MYEQFYGLGEKPFTLRPDPSFLYLSKKHAMGLSMLQYGLENHAGITVLTGEVGSGKTTLIRRLLDDIDGDVEVGLISNTHDSFGILMQWVAVAFDLPAENRSKAALYDEFSRFLIEQYAQGRRTILIIDEAQNLGKDMLEELRLLTNINADKDELLQLVLVGQPELREMLKDNALRQFVQRIGVDFHLSPLAASETDRYITHRLGVAGGDPGLFDPVARRLVHYLSRGVPRLINSLCDTTLVYAFADERELVTADIVAQVAAERLEQGLFGAGITSEVYADLGNETPAELMANLQRRALAEVEAEKAGGDR